MRTLVVLAAVLTVLGCQPQSNYVAPIPQPNPCAGGHGHQGPNPPVLVCIDYATFDGSTYEPDPNPAQANHSVKMDFWFYNYGTASPNLWIEFTRDTPVEHESSSGIHCSAVVKNNVQAHAHIQRKYSIIDTKSGRRRDPEVIIEP